MRSAQQWRCAYPSELFRRVLSRLGAEMLPGVRAGGSRRRKHLILQRRRDDRVILRIVPRVAHGQAVAAFLILLDQEGLDGDSRHIGLHSLWLSPIFTGESWSSVSAHIGGI